MTAALIAIFAGVLALAMLMVAIIVMMALRVARAFTSDHDEDTEHEMINRKVP